MAKPRWAFISPFQLRLRRGIESYVWSLAAALSESGVEIDILTWQGPLSPPDYLDGAQIRLRTVPSVRYYQHLVAVPYYVSQVFRNKYDHVFINFAGYGEAPALEFLRIVNAVPFSIVFHFPRNLVPHRYQEFERWQLSKHASHLVSVSHHLAAQVEGWAKRRCAVIGHGVDTERFRPDQEKREQIRESLGISANAYLLVTVAALEERKGIQWAIGALPKVIETFANTYYLVLGEGNYRAELASLVGNLGLQHHVILKCTVDNVESYLCAADVALLLSTGEASPVALLEYAASCLPVITSQKPPFGELVHDDWGVMVNETDAQHLSEIISSLLADREKRSLMGSAGRSWVETNHSWQQVARQYRHLIG
jgi:glycosyltransferase involved in cell wall biosynthesis